MLSSGAPEILKHPSDYKADLNAEVSFIVEADGKKPLQYKWFHNGQVIEGRNNVLSLLLAIDI